MTRSLYVCVCVRVCNAYCINQRIMCCLKRKRNNEWGEEIPKLAHESKREALVKHIKHLWGSKHINNREKLNK